MIQVGDRVYVRIKEAHMDVDGEGVIVHIQKDALLVDHFCPIQIELDEPYGETKQFVVRAKLKEVTKL